MSEGLSEGVISGILNGDRSDLIALQKYSAAVTREARGSGFLTDQVIGNIAETAFADALAAVLGRYCSTSAQLTTIVEIAITERVRNALRKSERYRFYLENVDANLDLDSPETFVRDDVYEEEEEVAGSTKPPKATLLYQGSSSTLSIARHDLQIVNQELLQHLRRHPDQMYHLAPRTFEEVFAAIMRNMGYTVQLTVQGADGGIDIIATQKTGFGELLCIVDCKRYAPTRPVGVQMVRSLYGISEAMRATMAILATTSYFTQPAKEFQRSVQNRLAFADYDRLVQLLHDYAESPPRT
jgi:restriction endonuclease Mrr